MQREIMDFGSGHLGIHNSFFEQPVAEQARQAAWNNGCPIPNELIEKRGAEAMLRRYSTVNFWFNYIGRELAEQNPTVFSDMMAPVARRAAEPPSQFETESVPLSYQYEMTPLGTLVGYDVGRLFTKQLGEDLPTDQAQERLARGLSVLDQVIPEARTPEHFLAMLAEGLSQADVEPIDALSNTLSLAWFQEHNSERLLVRMKEAIEDHAPELWKVYSHLSEADKAENKIA